MPHLRSVCLESLSFSSYRQIHAIKCKYFHLGKDQKPKKLAHTFPKEDKKSALIMFGGSPPVLFYARDVN